MEEIKQEFSEDLTERLGRYGYNTLKKITHSNPIKRRKKVWQSKEPITQFLIKAQELYTEQELRRFGDKKGFGKYFIKAKEQLPTLFKKATKLIKKKKIKPKRRKSLLKQTKKVLSPIKKLKVKKRKLIVKQYQQSEKKENAPKESKLTVKKPKEIKPAAKKEVKMITKENVKQEGKRIAEKIKAAGYETTEKIAAANLEEFLAKTGIQKDAAEKIIESAKEKTKKQEFLEPKKTIKKEEATISGELKKRMLDDDMLKEIRSNIASTFGNQEEFKNKLLEAATKNPEFRKEIIEKLTEKKLAS